MATSSYQSNQGQYISQSATHCLNCSFNLDVIFGQVLSKLADLRSLHDLDHVFGEAISLSCPHSHANLVAWCTQVEEGIRAIEPFVTYL
jgi:hypothetical protein